MIELPSSALPEDLKTEIKQNLESYSTTLIKVIRNRNNSETVDQIGSGTFVQVNNVYGILTANHVSRELTGDGELGLVLQEQEHSFTFPIKGLEIFQIGASENDAIGPDLSFVRLPSTNIGLIKANKVFYNLIHERNQLLENPPDIENGIWYIGGTIGELTKTVVSDAGFLMAKSFKGYVFESKPPRISERKGFDYYEFEVNYSGDGYIPNHFGGMSGGGVWQVLLRQSDNGEVYARRYILAGVIFYQIVEQGRVKVIRCHGRKSIYDIVVTHLTQK